MQGTLPFMSINVLLGRVEEHCYYHDLESLLYVLIWICTTQGGPHDVTRSESDCPFDDTGIAVWCANAPELVGRAKGAMMNCHKMFKTDIIYCLHVYFEPLSPLIEKWRDILLPHDIDDFVLTALGGIIPDICKRPADREAENVFADLIKAIDCTLIELRSSDSTSPPPIEDSASDGIKDALPSSLQAADPRTFSGSTTVNDDTPSNKTDVTPVALQAAKTDHKPRTQNFGKKRSRSPSCEQIVDYVSSHSPKASKRLKCSRTGCSV